MRLALVLGLTMLTHSACADEQSARLARRAEIDYYTSRYEGADIAFGQFNCRQPPVPMRLSTPAGGMEAARALAAWHGCYQRFLANYNAALPIGKTIPSDLADLMTDDEMRAAQAHMSQVFVRVASEAQRQADAVALAQTALERSRDDVALSMSRGQPEPSEGASKR